MPHGNPSGSPRRRPRHRKGVSASRLPDSIRVPARFGGADARSKFDAAAPSNSHAPAAKSAATRTQFRRRVKYPNSNNSSATKIQVRGPNQANFFNSSERKIPPAKKPTGKREGSFM